MEGYIFGERIFGVAYYWKDFCLSKWVGLNNKKILQKQPKTVSTNSPWAYIWEGLLSERFLFLLFRECFCFVFFFRGGGKGAYYHNFTVSCARVSHIDHSHLT